MPYKINKPSREVEKLIRELRDDFIRSANADINSPEAFTIATLFLALLKTEDRKVDLSLKIRSIEELADLESSFRGLIEWQMDLIDRVADDYSQEHIREALLYDDIFDSRTGSFPTPPSLTKLALDFLDLKEDDILLDLGSGKGTFIFEAFEEYDLARAYGAEINPEVVLMARIRAYILGFEVDFIEGNAIVKDYSHLEANKVFSNFPLGMRYRDNLRYVEENPQLLRYLKEAPMTITNDWLFILAGVLAMAPGGKFVCFMGRRGTWNAADIQIREMLVEKGLVEGVVELAEGLLPYTRIPLTMLVLSEGNKKVKMVDAEDIYTSPGRAMNILSQEDIERIAGLYEEESNLSRHVGFEELAANGYELSPVRYIEYEDDIKEGQPLGEVIKDIHRGAPMSGKKLSELESKEPSDYRYLLLQNINEGLMDEILPYLKDLDEKYHRYLLRDNSIIISRNAPFKITSVGKQESKILATGNLFFIEVDESKIDPLYLEAFLQSDRGQAQMTRLSKGTGIVTISIADLKEIMVPRLSPEEEEAIADEFGKSKMKQRMLVKQLENLKEDKASLFREVK